MRLKAIFNTLDSIKLFVNAVQMMTKHADRMIFIATKDQLTILVERPILWIDFDITKFAYIYNFTGDEQSETEDGYIYFDMKSMYVQMLDSLISSQIEYVEMALTQNVNKIPFLKFETKQITQGSKASLNFQIPIIVIPHQQWRTINVPRELSFDCCCLTPRYYLFKKYIDIYKHFKSLRFYIKPKSIILEAGSEIESRVMTSLSIKQANDEFGEPLEISRISAIVDPKRLSGFFHSIHALNLQKLEIVCRIKHSKYLKVDFQNEEETIMYNMILENIESLEELDEEAYAQQDNNLIEIE